MRVEEIEHAWEHSPIYISENYWDGHLLPSKDEMKKETVEALYSWALKAGIEASRSDVWKAILEHEHWFDGLPDERLGRNLLQEGFDGAKEE